MINVKDAKYIINVGTAVLDIVNAELNDCAGFALSTDFFSSTDFPDFEQSAMDGYGIYYENDSNLQFQIIGEEQAGNTEKVIRVKKGEAVRIFTGARIPDGVNTVVQQEWVQIENQILRIGDFAVKTGMNIRPRGSQTKRGELVLEKGSKLSPAGISLLAGLGAQYIEVVRKPRIAILNTGKELVAPGKSILRGQVYESNSFALNHALQEMNIIPAEITWVDDDLNVMTETISRILLSSDLVLITGGVSVGDYDYVVRALQANDVEQLFHHIKQKPGKPLYFGKKEKKLIFGLPGNPASVLTCFYQYVIPCIRKMMGFTYTELKQMLVPCMSNYEKKPGMTHFLKGKLSDEGVQILAHQESYKMNTYAEADVLIEIGEDTTQVQFNDPVKVYLLHV